MESGLVLADALEEKGYPRLAKDLRKIALPLWLESQDRWHKDLNVRPSRFSSTVRSLDKRLIHAIDEIAHDKKYDDVLWYIDAYAYPVRRLGKNYGSPRFPIAMFEMLIPFKKHMKRAELYVSDVHETPGKTRLARGAARFIRR
jgi:hypothetical protein